MSALPGSEPAVLIADNDAVIGALLGDVLARFGVPVVQAFDGSTARAMVRAPGLRVVVCDLDMPGASGLEVVASMADLTPPPAVVIVSGYVDADVAEELARWPFVRRVLRKPFDLLEFAAIVRDLVDGEGDGFGRGPEKGQGRP